MRRWMKSSEGIYEDGGTNEGGRRKEREKEGEREGKRGGRGREKKKKFGTNYNLSETTLSRLWFSLFLFFLFLFFLHM